MLRNAGYSEKVRSVCGVYVGAISKERSLSGQQAGAEPGICIGAKKEEKQEIVYYSDCPETVSRLAAQGLPVIYLEREGSEPVYEAEWVWQCTKEMPWPDENFMERVLRRALRLPWTVCLTDRLLIRESVPEDLEAFLEFYNEECENSDVGDWSDSPGEQLQRYIDGQYRIFGYGLWTVVLRETGEVIGRAGLERPGKNPMALHTEKSRDGVRRIEKIWQRRGKNFDDCLEISWLIGKDYRRKGYALEAAEAILRYADRELGCGSVIARTSAQNEASLLLIQKLRDLCRAGINETPACPGEPSVEIFLDDVPDGFVGSSEGDHDAGDCDQNRKTGGE